MKINQITATNVKGRSFDHELKPLTIITGENAKGKTAITDAITIAMLGYHPSLGKTNKATAKLAGAGAVMEVNASFDNGTELKRRWELKKTGTSLKTEGEAKDLDLEIGAFDVDAFITAPLTTKIETIARTLPASGEAITPKSLADKIKSRDNAHLIADWEGTGKTFGDQRKEAEEIRRDLRAEKKMMEETIAGIEMLGLDDEDQDPPSHDEIQKAKEEMMQASARVNQKNMALAALKSKQASKPSQREPSHEDFIQLENDYHYAVDTLDAAQKAAAQARESANEIKSLQDRINGIREIHENEIAKAKSNIDYDVQYPELEDPEVAINRISETRDFLSGTKSLLQKHEQELGKIVSQYDEMIQAKECPCCKRKGEGFKTAIKKIADESIINLEKEIKQNSTVIKNVEKELETLTQNYAIINGRKAIEDISKCEKKLRKLEKATPQADIAQLKSRLSTASGALQVNVDIKKKWDFYREFANESDKIPGIESEISELEIQEYDLKESLQSLVDKREGLSKVIHDRQRQAEGRTRLKAIKAEQTAYNKLIKDLKDAELNAAKQAFMPMSKITSVFLNGVVEGELTMRDTDIGIERDGQFIHFSTLSGAEQLAVGCSIKAAIANASASKILIADEVARMTVNLRKQFAKNCKQAITDKIIDQVILIDHEGAIAIGAKINVE